MRNIPPSGFRRFTTFKGTVPARKVPLRLHLLRKSDKQESDFELIWTTRENPRTLDEIPNDGTPIETCFLRYEPEKMQLWVPTGPVLEPGRYAHEIILPGNYDLTLCVGPTKWMKIDVMLPDFLEKKARNSDSANYCRDNGGYVVYLDKARYSEEFSDLEISCGGAISRLRTKEIYEKYSPARMLVNGEPYEGT